MTDDHFMSIALKLAEKNLGNVAPNPAVGCVIVKDGTIISEGYTGIGGRPHAEVVALQNTKDSTHGATVYITLEPCCHHGVTGPCTAKIIKAGVKRVVIATIDPDSRVSGGGIKALKEAGIEVEQGIMQKKAEELNVGFFTTKELHRPFIACKIATTLDGKIATFTGDSKWITSEDTRNWIHELRAKYDAVMIGSNTLINDDPLLTCRLPGLGSRSPIRLIIDSQAKLKEEQNIAKTADKVITWVITNKEVERKIKDINYLIVNSNHKPPVIPAHSSVTPTHSPVVPTPSPVIPVPRHWDPENLIATKQLHNENWIPLSRAGMTSEPDVIGKVCLKDMASKLVSAIGITRLLVEGGGVLITELLKCNLIDRLIICRSGKILGNDAIPFIGNLGIQSINNCYQFKKVEIIEFSKDVVEMWDRLP
ncbi:bifunctional diaminohydroxyphosphoribosylaminopyrimidine deaminase/5-amino-6-(5-phosphoribosylamino)uracil reductase RibD [Wolbachia endosymbiont (group A) of Sicus ferrugineus]|uniref:bifunctional diaminohydroxyphosphoribosylaminopyrimidine deaminase/5-amino-6-(5-phosphoribosylamino)uracil reductase RibD n=1 Tax=Wolbachia endosymbiont (group A) of Sicus ferrugineus TaxID=2954056 RepID=UPI0022311E47|nr:bifunctional diaminohydroxyphosphoribosylaminopyrimidine deaminase/5-amino-6-(5-phosphoribosylamino)uracil reductase RibD [Wolbachia endosymbiont (group A) of Sicus ferrugineus]